MYFHWCDAIRDRKSDLKLNVGQERLLIGPAMGCKRYEG
eukprot:COSAG05_NODE_10352_length_569_cov_0.721868_1_plen_38_part_10